MMRAKGHRLAPGMRCRIRSLGGDRRLAGRLAQMGILPGTVVTVVRSGPLGDPLELVLDQGGAVALRNREARLLQCQVLDMPLEAVEPGSGVYRVAALRGGGSFLSRMNDLGIAVGTRLSVEGGPPVRVRPEGSGRTVILGRGEALKVLVEPVDPGTNG